MAPPAAFVSDFHLTLAAPGRPLEDTALMTKLGSMRRAGVILVLNSSCDRGFLMGDPGLTPATAQLFDAIILEAGAVAWFPATGVEIALGPPHDIRIVAAFRDAGIPVEDLWTGHSLIGLRTDHLATARTAIAQVNAARIASGEPGLDLVETINGETVTYVPGGVNKATAMRHVLDRFFGISDLSTVTGAGDGANDREFLALCGVTVLPANAHASLRDLPGAVTSSLRYAAGTAEALDRAVAGPVIRRGGHAGFVGLS